MSGGNLPTVYYTQQGRNQRPLCLQEKRTPRQGKRGVLYSPNAGERLGYNSLDDPLQATA